MKNLSPIAAILITLAIAGVSYADPVRPDGAQVKIRTEYRGLAAPDHLMFAMHARTMNGIAESYRDIALDIVQKHMHLDSEEAAESFLSRMIATVGELDSEQGKIWDEAVCRPDAPRSKEALYKMLDLVDDLAEIKAHNVYVKFLSSLDEGQQEAMTAWLKEEKEGFYYRAAEHKSMFEASGSDVVERVQVICAVRASQ